MKKKHENPLENFCSMLAIMNVIDSCSARLKCHLIIKNLVCTHFYGSLDFGGLAVRLSWKENFRKLGLKKRPYAIPKINMFHNLSCCETRSRLLCC